MGHSGGLARDLRADEENRQAAENGGPARFVKKPVEVEAFCLTDAQRKAGGPFPEWALPHLTLRRTEKISNSERIVITTLEGEMHASVGDWIIRGVKGEVYPCKPDIFAETYDPA